jgi:hypothetical protein
MNPPNSTALAHHDFPDAEFIEGDSVLSPHDRLITSLEEFNDGRGPHPPHQLPEETVMMTTAVDNAAALGSDIFLGDSYSTYVRSGAGRVRLKGRLSTTKKIEKVDCEYTFRNIATSLISLYITSASKSHSA